VAQNDSLFLADIDNQSQIEIDRLISLRLDQLPLNQTAEISSIDWAALDIREGRRLQELGFNEGASVEALHAGGFFTRDPIAVRVGRMTVAIRRAHARAMKVVTR
jgi:ferrous iron transport protein A